jgi:hypothetical protein
MKYVNSALSGLAVLLLVTGCNRAETPAEVRQDVAEAHREGAEQVAEARADLAQDRADAGQAFNESTAENRYVLQLAKADADRKVALEQCEALSGSPQEACKELAEEKHELRMAEAERLREEM